jgi:3',5'-cyclic-AMP phosphodiesterase
MLIAHISDTHIMPAGQKAYGVAPVGELLERTIAHINAFVPAVDVVVLTGDVTSSGRPEEAQEAARLLAALNCPFYVIPGNHDERETLWHSFGGGACPSRDDGFISYTVEDHPLRLIALDSTHTGSPGGAFCASRAAWLKARLAEQPGRSTVLLLHHPPLNCGVLETDEDGFEGVEELAEIITRQDNIVRVLCGHIHLSAHASWCGTSVSVAPATGMELRLDLTREKPSAFFLQKPAFLLHYCPPEAVMVSHLVQVSDGNEFYSFDLEK